MGTITKERSETGLADALFTTVQQRVLGLLFGQPDRRFQSSEIIRLAGSGTGAVHRFLTRLAEAHLVSVTRTGNQKHYRANRESPIFAELHGLALKTSGLVGPIMEALRRHAEAIQAAFIYGSVAKGPDTASSDIDLMIVSDSLTYPDAVEALQVAESLLSRPIHPNVLTLAEWRARVAEPDSFAARIAAGPRLFVTGSDDELR